MVALALHGRRFVVAAPLGLLGSSSRQGDEMSSFEDEMHAFMQHRAEQNPHLHALQAGERTVADLGVQEALELLADIGSMQTALLLSVAKEIDRLRASSDSR